MINRSTIRTFKSYMQLFENMNTMNYVISFTGVVRATMDIFSSDASWIVETEGDITEKTDATHSIPVGLVMFFQIVIIFGSNTVLRMMLNYPFNPIVAVLSGLLPPADRSCPSIKPNIMRSFAQSTSPFFPHVRATLVCIFSVHHQLPPLLAQASSQLRAGQSFFRGKYNNSNNNNNINNNSKITIMIQNV